MDFLAGWSEENQGVSIFRGHRPGACPWKMFSWSLVDIRLLTSSHISHLVFKQIILTKWTKIF